MTRVEKYRRYREEIANMKFENSSNKKTISQKIGRMCDTNESSKLGYEQVLDVLESYDPDVKVSKKRHQIRLRKRQIIYYAVAGVVILGLLVGIIITAINL